jgi:hypothetical protein
VCVRSVVQTTHPSAFESWLRVRLRVPVCSVEWRTIQATAAQSCEWMNEANSMKHSLQKLNGSQLNSPHCMEPEVSLPHSQVPATCPYPASNLWIIVTSEDRMWIGVPLRRVARARNVPAKCKAAAGSISGTVDRSNDAIRYVTNLIHSSTSLRDSETPADVPSSTKLSKISASEPQITLEWVQFYVFVDTTDWVMSPVRSVLWDQMKVHQRRNTRGHTVQVWLLSFWTVRYCRFFDLESGFAGAEAELHVFTARRQCIAVTNTSCYFRIEH